MSSRTGVVAAAVFCVTAMLAGCTPAPTASPTPTPAFTSEAQAYAAAEATYRAYVDASNNIDLSDPGTFEAVYSLTTGVQHSDDKKSLSSYYANNVRVSGDSQIKDVVPQAFSRNSGKVLLDVCLDVSEVTLKDSSGTSLVSPDRVDVQSLSVTAIPTPGNKSKYEISLIEGRQAGKKC